MVQLSRYVTTEYDKGMNAKIGDLCESWEGAEQGTQPSPDVRDSWPESEG